MRRFVCCILLGTAFLTGCVQREEKIDPTFVLGDLALERQRKLNFTTPATLEDLEKLVADKGGWIDNELKDDDLLIYQYLNGQPAPTTVEEARRLTNDSDEANAKIRYTLGRLPDEGVLPPTENYQAVDYHASFTRHSAADASSFNPLLVSSVADFEISGLMGISLFGFTYDTFEPYVSKGFCKAWQSSADHLVDRITIREDITWSDGQPFTARDVEFTYKVIMSSRVPIPAMRSGTDLLVDVKAYDDHTLVFFHEKAMPINVFNMMFSIIPEHIYRDSIQRDPTLVKSPTHAKLEKQPVVAGPYVVEKRTRDSEIVLKRREGYYMYQGKQVRAKPMFERIRFRISPETSTAFMKMVKGDIEAMELTPELWTTQTDNANYTQNNTKVRSEQWTYFAFWWNMKNPLFQDKKVREALDVAFDHEEMLKTLRCGLDTPCTGLFAPGSPWYPKDAGLEPTRRDVEKAKKLLEEAGWKDTDNDGILDKEIAGKKTPFQFAMITSNRPERIALCRQLSINLKEIGIDMTVSPLEFTVWMDFMQEKKFQAALGGWGAGSDPYTAWNVWGTGEARNNISYSNPEVDRLFREGELEFDRAKRMAIYQKIHLLIYNDHPCAWLFNMNGYYGFNKNVRGIGYYPRGPIYGTAWKETRQ
ncbi:MAG: ABC transporter substrate-binding protein [Planctomycetia bacterium]|nr:ABC transporter substrate-binding protein [Planctomycetia bacterium]